MVVVETRNTTKANSRAEPLPVLFSFRRCPYAMRARLALVASGQAVALREVVLRDKPRAMLEVSPKGTVPVLVLPDGTVIDESLDIMRWALTQSDPEGWRAHTPATLNEMDKLIERIDGPFKQALDRYKYTMRYEGADREAERARASAIVDELEAQLAKGDFLFADRFLFADAAILPFIRQFAHTDIEWFSKQDWPRVQAWLDQFLASDRFKAIMGKYPAWRPDDPPVIFGNG